MAKCPQDAHGQWLKRLAVAAKAGAIPGGSIENGTLKLDRLTADVPADTDELVLDLY